MSHECADECDREVVASPRKRKLTRGEAESPFFLTFNDISSIISLNLERWPSGLRQQFTKLPGSKGPLEFESLSLRTSKKNDLCRSFFV